jgi:hypothetical protein
MLLMSDLDAEKVTILRLGAEGGSLELVSAKDQSGWRFQVRTDEGTLLGLLSDEDAEGLEACHAGPWVCSWREALDQLETSYPYWRRLYPLYVEPAFRAQIVGAFLRAGTTDRDPLDHLQDILHRWSIVLASPGRVRRLGADPGRPLGEHPTKGGPVVAKKERFGPYVTHDGIHATIPADKTPALTLEEAVSLLDAASRRRGPRSS